MNINKVDHICIARPFRDCEFAFIHPKKMNGVLLELIDDKEAR